MRHATCWVLCVCVCVCLSLCLSLLYPQCLEQYQALTGIQYVFIGNFDWMFKRRGHV